MADPLTYRWMDVARSYLGIREGEGTADNPKVVELYALCCHPEVKHDAVPWCAAFVGGVLSKSLMKGTGTLWALDYAKWGQKLDAPIYGCVASKKRNGGGHVGFVVGANERQIILLGGNQGDCVSIAAFPRADFVAFRWPAEVPIPAHISQLPTTVAGSRSGVSEA